MNAILLRETPEDRQNEARILRGVAKAWNVDLKFTSLAYPIDAVFLKHGKPVGFGEVRVRDNSMHKYPTFSWSLQKYICASHYSRFLPTCLFVEWDEGLYWTKITGEPLAVSYMNRKKTTERTKADNEPCVEIPLTNFKPFTHGKN